MLELNRIYHEDCLDTMSRIETGSIDLIVADPPYKVSQNYGNGVDADNLIAVASIMQVMPEISRVLKRGRFAVIFYDNRIFPLLFQSVHGTSLVYRKTVNLYRRWGVAHRWVGWMQCTDPICFFVNGHEQPFSPSDVRGKVKHDTYIKDKPEKENTGHPAQKPLEVCEDIITWCSNEGDLIYDPYVGSGTVPMAAKRLGRNFIGSENNIDYVRMAESRLNGTSRNVDLQGVLALQHNAS